MNKNLKSISQTLALILVIIVSFTIGFMFARRENYNQSANQITIQANNGFIENSLTKIQSRELFGIVEGEKKVYGQLLFKVLDGNQTEIYIKIENFPQTIVNPTDKTNFSINNLEVQTAKICCNGLDYNIQKTNLNIALESRAGRASANFSSILGNNILLGYDRLIFTNEKENPYKVTKDNQRDWPRNTTDKSAPYLWANI